MHVCVTVCVCVCVCHCVCQCVCVCVCVCVHVCVTMCVCNFVVIMQYWLCNVRSLILCMPRGCDHVTRTLSPCAQLVELCSTII